MSEVLYIFFYDTNAPKFMYKILVLHHLPVTKQKQVKNGVSITALKHKYDRNFMSEWIKDKKKKSVIQNIWIIRRYIHRVIALSADSFN